jgi:hypothetical protein
VTARLNLERFVERWPYEPEDLRTDTGLRGVRCRLAQAPRGAGRELAWFPATARSRATLVERRSFDAWYWA